jgi:hypothetical protein
MRWPCTIQICSDTARTASANSWMCRQRLSRPTAPLLLSCPPNRSGKVNSLLDIFSTSRRISITASLHLHAQISPQPRLRRAFTRRDPCVPSRSEPGPSHALHQVGKQGCPNFGALIPEGRQQARDSGHSLFRGPARGRSPRARISSFLPSSAAGSNPSAFPCSSSQSLMRRL